MNGIDKTNWKDYAHAASSLWLIDKDSDTSPRKKGFYGGFVYQVAENLINRYTEPMAFVLDMFGGSGTTERACMALGRNSVTTDIHFKPDIKQFFVGPGNTTHYKYKADAAAEKYVATPPCKLIIIHPPYYDIIKYSNKKGEMSNMTPDVFDRSMYSVGANAIDRCPTGGHVALIFGDVYRDKTLIPAHHVAGLLTYGMTLGSLGKSREIALRAIYIKNITGNERGKGKAKGLWQYRALVNGFAVFEHEYIFVWKVLK